MVVFFYILIYNKLHKRGFSMLHNNYLYINAFPNGIPQELVVQPQQYFSYGTPEFTFEELEKNVKRTMYTNIKFINRDKINQILDFLKEAYEKDKNFYHITSDGYSNNISISNKIFLITNLANKYSISDLIVFNNRNGEETYDSICEPILSFEIKIQCHINESINYIEHALNDFLSNIKKELLLISEVAKITKKYTLETDSLKQKELKSLLVDSKDKLKSYQSARDCAHDNLTLISNNKDNQKFMRNFFSYTN